MKKFSMQIRWLYLTVGVIAMLFSGILYAWSILRVPLGEEFGWNSSQMSLNFTLAMCFFCIGVILAGTLLRSISLHVVLTAGAVATCTGFVLVSRNHGNIEALYISYGVLCGVGIGIAYNVVLSSVGAWFPDKRGVCSGALMMGFGISTMVLGNAASILISTAGWRTTYLILGAVIGGILLIAGMVLRFPPAGTLLPVGIQKPVVTEEGTMEFTTAEIIRRFSFWKFFFFALTLGAVGNTVISFAKQFAQDGLGASPAMATSLVGILSVCNGLGRVLCGAIFDRIGRKRTMFLANLLALMATGISLLSLLIGNLPLGIAGLCLTGFSYSCGPTISAVVTSTFYGNRHFALNFSVVNMNLIPASFVAVFAGRLVDTTGGYFAAFGMLIVLSVCSLILNLSIHGA